MARRLYTVEGINHITLAAYQVVTGHCIRIGDKVQPGVSLRLNDIQKLQSTLSDADNYRVGDLIVAWLEQELDNTRRALLRLGDSNAENLVNCTKEDDKPKA